MPYAVRRGFSLVELLVCIAIIGVIMSMYLPALSKAMRKAREVAQSEAYRQEHIGTLSDKANSVHRDPPATREQCRAAFRQRLNDEWVSQVLYSVSNDDEFTAYWNTLLNPAYTAALKHEGNSLIAVHPNGTTYSLAAHNDPMDIGSAGIVGWLFLSTDLNDTSSATLGGNVLFGDGHVVYVRYPEAFPMTATVAMLSHQFVLDFGNPQ